MTWKSLAFPVLSIACAVALHRCGEPPRRPAAGTATAVLVQASAAAVASDTAARKPATRSKTPEVNDAYRAYAQSRRLSDLLPGLRAGIEQGDTIAFHLYLRAMRECAIMRSNPAFVVDGAAAAVGAHQAVRKAHLDRYAERCRDFNEALDASPPVDVDAAAQRIRERGDALEIARSIETGDAERAPEPTSRRVRTVLASKEPEAINALAAAMGRASGRQDVMSRYSGERVYEYAWRLVACDLGMDCSAESYMVRQLCVFGGTCVNGDLKEVYRQSALSPEEYERATASEREILAYVTHGSIDGLFQSP